MMGAHNEDIRSLILRLKGSELINGSFWSVFGAVLSKGILFCAWILVGRILGTYEYGEFGVIRNTILMFSSFAGFGLGLTATKYVSEYLKCDKSKVERLIGLSLLFGFIMGISIFVLTMILSPWLANDMLKSPRLTIDLQIASITLLFSSINGAQTGVLQGVQAFKHIALLNLNQSLIAFPLFIVGAYYGGVRGSVVAYALSIILNCVLSYFAIRKEMKQYHLVADYKNAWIEKSVLYKFSLPAVLSGILATVFKWFADIMLINTSNGYNAMGIFTAVYTFNTVLMMLSVMLDAPFLTVMSKQKSSENKKLSKLNILLPWFLGIWIITPFLIFPELGSVLFGEEFAGRDFKWAFVGVLLFSLLLMFKQGLTRILAVYDLQWFGAFSNLVWGIVLLFSFCFLKIYGAIGLAFSYLIAYTVNTLVTLPVYFYRKIIPQSTILSKYSVAVWALILGLVLLNFFVLSLYVKMLVLVIVYVLSVIIFKSLIRYGHK